jgi:hypothetical protein
MEKNGTVSDIYVGSKTIKPRRKIIVTTKGTWRRL